MLTNYQLNNFYFIQQLQKKTDEDVILFGLDGMSYYGRLKEIDCKDNATLCPAMLSSTNLVEVQNPAEVAAVENSVKVELSNLVGFGYNILADPFVLPDENKEDVTDGNTTAYTENLGEIFIHNNECCCENDNLQKNKLITIFTLGGFIFAGNLLDKQQETARLTGEYIFAPGGDGSTLFSINRVVVNLNAATAIGL